MGRWEEGRRWTGLPLRGVGGEEVLGEQGQQHAIRYIGLNANQFPTNSPGAGRMEAPEEGTV